MERDGYLLLVTLHKFAKPSCRVGSRTDVMVNSERIRKRKERIRKLREGKKVVHERMEKPNRKQRRKLQSLKRKRGKEENEFLEIFQRK